jgi:endonuclease YncB( thermonuclease family)
MIIRLFGIGFLRTLRKSNWCVRLTLLILLLTLDHTAAAEISGRVVGITDGDTLTILIDQRPRKIRLAEIDAPESGQPYGSRARQALSDLAFSKPARVVEQGTDRYGRTIGRVYVGSVDVNAALVRQGAAWVYRQYSHDDALLRLEQEARAARRDLWALSETQRIPPWEWRAAERGRSGHVTSPSASGSPPAAFACGTKRYCREMTSCAEARFYWSQCGLTRLDGDHDGIPCEMLCR